MTTPLTFERRMELVERDERDLAELLAAQARNPQGLGKRWTHWALTTLPAVGSYPGDGTNTFPIRFCEPTYTPTAGAQMLLAQPNSTQPVTVARTTNGQWCLPGEMVMASPIPPPHGTTGKGRWLITPVKTYYYGFLSEELTRLGSALVDVHVHGPAGTWTDTGYDQTVWDSGFLAAGQKLPIGTWVRFEWSRVGWVVTHYFGLGRLARAKLSYDLCGGDTATVEDFEFLLGGTLAAPPTTASNLFHHRGLVGDWVLLAETTLHASGWLVIDVEKHAYKVFTDLRQTGDCIHWCVEGKAVIAALEVCAVPAWETIYCNPCATYPETSVFVETSLGLTSVPAFGCCVDTLNLDLGITTYDDLGDVIGTTADTPLFASINSAGLCIPGGFGLYNPREWDINHPENHVNYHPSQTGQVSMTSFVNGGPYDGDPAWGLVCESWHIECARRINPMTGALLFPDDPTQREWRLVGTIGQQMTSGAYGFTLMIFESGVAIYILTDGYRALTQGSLTVHSCNPFHATATFVSLGDNWTDPEGGTGRNMSYPTEGCTTSSFEITE